MDRGRSLNVFWQESSIDNWLMIDNIIRPTDGVYG